MLLSQPVLLSQLALLVLPVLLAPLALLVLLVLLVLLAGSILASRRYVSPPQQLLVQPPLSHELLLHLLAVMLQQILVVLQLVRLPTAELCFSQPYPPPE